MEKIHIVQNLKEKLDEMTLYDTYWYPLNKLKIDIPVIAFNIDKIYQDNYINFIETIMKECNILEVTSVQLEQEIVLDNLNIFELLKESDEDGYNFPWCIETYYFDDKKDWMIYVSHEGSITFSGKRMVEVAKKVIPQAYIY